MTESASCATLTRMLENLRTILGGLAFAGALYTWGWVTTIDPPTPPTASAHVDCECAELASVKGPKYDAVLAATH